jgi:hypothetical protein
MFVEYPVNWQLEKCGVRRRSFLSEGRGFRDSERKVQLDAPATIGWITRILDRSGIPTAFAERADVTKKVTH